MADREVRAAGGVVWRRVDGVVEVALVHRPRYDDWSLPKGKLDGGESWVAGGVREVREETGFTAVPGRTLGASRYRVLDRGRDVRKTVRWWAMRCVSGAFVPGPEVDALRWVPAPQAAAQASSAHDEAPLAGFLAEPADTTTVLVVSRWRDVLATYCPERVVALPGACVDDRLGLPVEAASDDLDVLLPRVAARGVPTVVWAPPDAVQGACGPGEWALSYAGARRVDADRLDQARS